MPIKKIMIIDDSPTERFFLQDMLTKKGFNVVIAENGEDGVARAKHHAHRGRGAAAGGFGDGDGAVDALHLRAPRDGRGHHSAAKEGEPDGEELASEFHGVR